MSQPAANVKGVPLTDRDLAILDFEQRRPRHDGAKEEAIGRELELAPARYYQLLDRLIDDADALRYAPMLIGRLQRLRAERDREQRARLGDDGV